ILAVVWAYVYFVVDPRINFDRAWVPFYFEESFFAQLVRRPGGLLHYAAAFTLQLDQFRGTGALVTTLLVGILGCVFWKPLPRQKVFWCLVPILPGLTVLAVETRYAEAAYELAFGILIASLMLLAFKNLRSGSSLARGTVFVLFSIVVLWIGGGLPALAFVVSVLVIEMRRTRSLAISRFYAAWTLVIVGYALTHWNALARELVGTRSDAVASLARSLAYLSVPLLGALCSVKFSQPAVQPGSKSCDSISCYTKKGFIESCVLERRKRIFLIVASGVAGVVLCFISDKGARLSSRIELAARECRWEEVLQSARKLKTWPSPVVRLAIARALYHTGKLHQELFAYPQVKGVEILPWLRESLDICDLLADTMLELGQVNLADHFAHESLELKGERPHTLWQLARIYVLKDQPKAASVFLKRLSHIPFHRTRAEKRLQLIRSDPALSNEPDISRIRSLRVTTDIADSGLPTETVLNQCLSSNRRNRMAFELLIAHYLLEDRPEPVVKSLDSLGEFGIWQTPRHIEEAILLYNSIASDTNAVHVTRPISADTNRRFERFRATMAAHGGRASEARTALVREFGDTYWYYHFFGQTYGAAIDIR
ncbi:MAG: SPO22/ZIP4 family meiosis protein, partial [Verrucomicrobiae bacterium]|nr:SPO22/ZIP4 family meiosis protein [Verrucomicrobiae bacterium]